VNQNRATHGATHFLKTKKAFTWYTFLTGFDEPINGSSGRLSGSHNS